MRRHLYLCALPLALVALSHLLSLPPAQQDLGQQRMVLSGRADQLDLVQQLPAGQRELALQQLLAELHRAQRRRPELVPSAVTTQLEHCRTRSTACGAASQALGGWRAAAARSSRRRLWLALGAAGLQGLAFALCALVVGRQLWRGGRTSRANVTLLLLGLGCGVGGAVVDIRAQLLQQRHMGQRARMERNVTRGRLALQLPADGRREQLTLVAGELARAGVRPELARQLERPRPRHEVLRVLARIYSSWPMTQNLRWIERWIGWIGAALLLLVAPATVRAAP